MKLRRALLLPFLGIGVVVGAAAHAQPAPKEPPSTTLVVQGESPANPTPGSDSGEAAPSVGAMDAMLVYTPPALVKYKKPIAMNSFWEKLAQCETASDWQNGGRWGGGLGIYQGTWETFGGREFASRPGRATKEEQIEIANRISVLGYKTVRHRDPAKAKRMGVPVSYVWDKDPVGFTGWGCYKSKSTGKYRMAKPKLVAHVPETVIGQKFKWGQKGRLVMDLQAIIDIEQDGKYGKKTWAAHQKYVVLNGLPRQLVPTPVLHRPKHVPYKSLTKKCPQYEEMLYNAGFPRNQIKIASYVMWKESRCVVDAKNVKDPKGGSYGLMQVNGFWIDRLKDAGIIKKARDLYDPQTNANAAFYVWIETSISNRYSYGWGAWSIY